MSSDATPTSEPLAPAAASLRQLGYLPAWQVFLASRRLGATGFRPEDWGPSLPLPSRKKLRREFHLARQAGARVAVLRTGHGAVGLDETRAQARYLGFEDCLDYIADACALARETKGPGGRTLLPALEVSPATEDQLRRLGPLVDHFRFNLDAADDALLDTPAFAGFPDKRAERQAAQLQAFLAAGVRVAAVAMVGIGESEASRRATLELLRDFHAEGGRLAAVSVTPFSPYQRAPMRGHPMPAYAETLAAAALARELLPPEVVVSLQPEGRDDLLDAVRDGQAPPDIGAVTLNRTLTNGMPEGHWFESRLGPANRFARGGSGEPIRERDRGVEWVERRATGPWPALGPARSNGSAANSSGE